MPSRGTVGTDRFLQHEESHPTSKMNHRLPFVEFSLERFGTISMWAMMWDVRYP